MSRPLTIEDLEFIRRLNATHPATEATPYMKQAENYDQQASELDKQAATPYPQPKSFSDRIVAGIRGGMEDFGRLGAPGGSQGQEQIRQKQFADEQASRTNRAKQLRDQAQSQQELGQTIVQRGVQNKLQNDQLDETRRLREIQEAELGIKKADAAKPTLHNTPTGSRTDAFDSRGLPIPGSTVEGTVKPVTEKNQGFRDAVNSKGETVRSYFNQSDPSTVTFSENLGVKQTPQNDYSGKVQAQSTKDGVTILGVLDKATGVFTPAKEQGGGGPVQGNAEGNANARAGNSATVDLIGAERLYKTMQDTLGRIKSGKSSAVGADDMVLLSNHIAMTFGTVKGARTGKDLIEAHLRARSLPDNLAVLAQRVTNGEQLTPGQREEFVELAGRRVNELRQSRADLDEYFGGQQSAPTAPVQPQTGTKRIRIN